ncbi:hypothetical protein [Modestobacter marinus]|uniref:hypothetical protein n=1 Tax=Modestobacter marinus TaxID=477641 RepID=UPI001C977A42|nr:hypothetical protein [Modestobacter marinus]
MNRVSADVYDRRLTRGDGGRLVPVSTYLESWIVDAPVVSWSRCQVEITGTVRYWRGSHPATTVRIVVPWRHGAIGPAEVTLTPGSGAAATYSCSFRSDSFRDVTLETDYCRSINQTPQLPTYDTTWHATRPPDTAQRVLTVEEAYREAGIGVTVDPVHTEIDDSAPGFATWSPAELHDAMEVAFGQFPQAWPSWNLWGLLAGSFQNTQVGGIMFDAAATFGGAGDAPERQGFAVFRDHTWFNDLVPGRPATQDQARAMRHFLYTWVHEAGHAFNFLHSWDKARPDSLSWMNYDWRYDERNGPDSFWSDFRFRFDDEELVHLRHGDRASVIMGGDPWASGGHLEAPAGAMAETQPGAGAELLLRSKGYFDFMEPVEIEVRVRNTSPDPIELDARFEPEYGTTVVYVRHPDDRVTMFAPVMCLYGMPETVTLEPLASDLSNEGRDRYSARLSVTYGRRGFTFAEPGEYLLRVVYTAGDLLLTSNTMRLRVGRPTDREQDRFAHEFFTPQVGLALVLNGSQSPFLEGGMDRLREAAGQFAGSELGAKAAYAVAHSVGNDFYRRQDDQLVRSHQADPAEALALTDAAVAYYREEGNRQQNLAYHQLGRLRAELHAQADAVRAARDELELLRTDLAERGVKKPVLDDIGAFRASLS